MELFFPFIFKCLYYRVMKSPSYNSFLVANCLQNLNQSKTVSSNLEVTNVGNLPFFILLSFSFLVLTLYHDHPNFFVASFVFKVFFEICLPDFDPFYIFFYVTLPSFNYWTILCDLYDYLKFWNSYRKCVYNSWLLLVLNRNPLNFVF